MRTLMFATMLAATAVADEIAEKYPVAENVRGHENTEWSISYAYHLTDAKKNLPRVLLVGDSICQGYQGKVIATWGTRRSAFAWLRLASDLRLQWRGRGACDKPGAA